MKKQKNFIYPGHKATILTILMVATLLCLGTWQKQRLAWKENMLGMLRVEMMRPAQDLPAEIDAPETYLFRMVTVTGTYDLDHVFYLTPRTENGQVGSHRIVPFQYHGDHWILVNTGWVSDEGINDLPRGKTTLTGHLRLPEKNMFTPDNNPSDNAWHWFDLDAMGNDLGHNVLPLIFYQGKADLSRIPNDHFQYMLFWYFMAVIALTIYGLSWRKKRGTT